MPSANVYLPSVILTFVPSLFFIPFPTGTHTYWFPIPFPIPSIISLSSITIPSVTFIPLSAATLKPCGIFLN